MSHPLWVLLPAVFLLNLPFGFWREGLCKLSPAWFLAVHAPIPFIAGMRALSGYGFRFSTLPLFLAAYFAGQLVGGRIRRRRDASADGPVPGAAGRGGGTPPGEG